MEILCFRVFLRIAYNADNGFKAGLTSLGLFLVTFSVRNNDQLKLS